VGHAAFLKALNSPKPPELEKLSALEARKVLETAQASVDVDYSGIDESERTITADGFKIAPERRPPGGRDRQAARGSCSSTVAAGCWATTRRIGVSCATSSWSRATAPSFVNYTRTPDAVFPRQINEIYAATKWVASHGTRSTSTAEISPSSATASAGT
jgi:hypothetical protein